MAKKVTETFFKRYLDRTHAQKTEELLEESHTTVLRLLESIDEETSLFRYAPEKWNIKEVVSHMIDVERVMSFRALWFARGQVSDLLPGFDDVDWEAKSCTSQYSFEEIIGMYKETRKASISTLKSIDPNDFSNVGEASDVIFTVDSLFRVIAGHEQHHMDILQERYLV